MYASIMKFILNGLLNISHQLFVSLENNIASIVYNTERNSSQKIKGSYNVRSKQVTISSLTLHFIRSLEISTEKYHSMSISIRF